MLRFNNFNLKSLITVLRPATILVVVTILVFSAYTYTAIWQHNHLLTHGHDLGIFDQGIWKLSQFQEPFITVRKIPVHFFGDHFHPILLTLVPFYWIFNSPYVLLIAQALLFSATIPLIYLLTKRLISGNWIGVIIAATVGTHLGLRKAIQFDFHEVAFAVPLLILIFLLIEYRKWKWYWIALALLMLTKESMPVYTALIGMTLLLRKQWKPGILTVGISLIAFFIITRLIIPHFAGGLGYAYWDQYQHLAPSSASMIVDAIHHPFKYIDEFFNHPDKRSIIVWLLGSFAFLPLFSPTTWPFLITTLAERLWANNPLLWRMEFHYQVMMVGVFGVASVYALRSLQQRWQAPPRVIMILVLTMFASSIVTHRHFFGLQRVTNTTLQQQTFEDRKKALEVIPASASVSAQDALVPHLSHRETIYQFPRVREAEYIVLDPGVSGWPMTSQKIIGWQVMLKNNTDWTLVHEKNQLTVFQRQGSAQILPTVLGWE